MLIILDRIRDRSEHIYVTDLTDNESARAAANKGKSQAATMDPIARAIQEWGRDHRSLRTLRVTTKENATADDMSRHAKPHTSTRPDSPSEPQTRELCQEAAGWELAKRLRVPYVEHTMRAHEWTALWDLMHLAPDPLTHPPTPS